VLGSARKFLKSMIISVLGGYVLFLNHRHLKVSFFY
jgi:hypothetical protein